MTNTLDHQEKVAKKMKNHLEDEVSKRDLTITKLNQMIEGHENKIKALIKEKDEANEQIAKTTEGKSTSEKYYSNKVKELEEELSSTQNQLMETKQALATVESEFEGFKKKKEEEVEGLKAKINNFINDQALLKNQSDSTTKDFLAFKQAKESEIETLTSKNQELTKEKDNL